MPTERRDQAPASEQTAGPVKTEEYDRIAERLAAQKADGAVRRFDDLDAIREAARAR
jgi:hypothetical protein